ncbi:hypothetical protein [Nostoc sp. 'Peltigera membranacea cyanobiont' 213]|uniref:hypothetical protein n=1 Tax=Nostoc sp. 'Peltigera membranacea cyanobiont' 213 TaxID=2014530 RepID=UPI00167DFA9E|nr:hypothetical protein [Nostoc sp. 'Peltigera membranacea cyanobiont' 213]
MYLSAFQRFYLSQIAVRLLYTSGILDNLSGDLVAPLVSRLHSRLLIFSGYG